MSSLKKSVRIGTDISGFKKSLGLLSDCIKELSLLVAPDVSAECNEFKKNQLHNLLLGENGESNSLDESSIDPYKVYDSFLKSTSSSVYSHLGIINARDIGCHFDELSDGGEISILDLHTRKVDWCVNCSRQNSNKPNFKKGSINMFSCWRRGHSSGKLGFLHRSELSVLNGNIIIKVSEIFTSKEMQAMSYTKFKQNNIRVGENILDIGTSMVCLVHLNSKRNKETDRTSEIKGLLNQQLLISKNISLANPDARKGEKQPTDQIPQFIEKLLYSVHEKWDLDGPSSDSRGLLGIALIHNEDKYTTSSVFQNILKSFARDKGIWFLDYQFKTLPNIIKQKLNISEFLVPKDTSVLCLIADPIIDLGVTYIE